VSLIPRSRGGALLRFAIGAVIVIGFTAATTAVAGLLQFKQFASDLSLTPALQQARVKLPNPGEPQTLLLIGSDHRYGDPGNQANTDTMILVRLDPKSSTINVMSVPRDLKVQIPEGGRLVDDKLNATYSIGGPNLLVRVLRDQVFRDLDINHIIVTTFGGFQSVVNAVGCVYTDVDHRYYNNTAVTNYSSIDIQPGYQKLCGSDALAFVRFRYSDNDIVRSARQQDFIRWAKDQYGSNQLISNRDTLLKIFGQNTQTDADLHSIDGLINLFNLVAFSAGHAIKQVPFPAIILPCGPPPAGAIGAAAQTPCYVTANPAAEQRAFFDFMSETPAQSTPPSGGGGGGGGPPPGPGRGAGVSADVADGNAQAGALGGVGMPVYFPAMIANGSKYEGPTPGQYPRGYVIHDPSGSSYSAYRLTLSLNPALGQYYGIQGTTWQNPPILRGPSQPRNVGGKQLSLYFNGHKLVLVALHTPGGVYWVSNTLTDDLSNQQMLGIASSLTRAGP